MSKPIAFNRRRVALCVAVVALPVGFVALHDAYEGRGGQTPWFLRWLSFW